MPGLALFQKSEDQPHETRLDRFLAAKGASSGRLVFALDATASRLPLWNTARELTAGMTAAGSKVPRNAPPADGRRTRPGCRR
jgi:hypothetical protein